MLFLKLVKNKQRNLLLSQVLGIVKGTQAKKKCLEDEKLSREVWATVQ